MKWLDKRFYSFNYFLRNTFNEKIIKISLNAGLTCPNRDGTLSTEGCIFCSESGSGDFLESNDMSIKQQFLKYREKLSPKWKEAKFIAYFQSFTNTYADVGYLKKIFYEAISIEGVVAISIATRPDCLKLEILELLKDLTKVTFVFVELGFQTSKESSIKLINRCYENYAFEQACANLKKINVNIVCHCIIGLPFETKEDILKTIEYVAGQNIDGIKLQLLHVLKNTKLDKMYQENLFKTLTFEQYIDILVSCIENLPENIVVHRITGDGDSSILVAPTYSLDKRKILNTVDKMLLQKDSWQGKELLFNNLR